MDPPKIFVSTAALLPVACMEARQGVEERENIGRKPLVGEHAGKGVPEESERLGTLQVLPVQSLESFDRRKTAPVDCLNVPHSYWAHDTGNTIAKQPD